MNHVLHCFVGTFFYLLWKRALRIPAEKRPIKSCVEENHSCQTTKESMHIDLPLMWMYFCFFSRFHSRRMEFSTIPNVALLSKSNSPESLLFFAICHWIYAILLFEKRFHAFRRVMRWIYSFAFHLHLMCNRQFNEFMHFSSDIMVCVAVSFVVVALCLYTCCIRRVDSMHWNLFTHQVQQKSILVLNQERKNVGKTVDLNKFS